MLPSPSPPRPNSPRERLPNFLLAASTPSNTQPTPPRHPPFPQARRQVAFNDRLRTDRPQTPPPSQPPPEHGRTPSRMPPTKSLLDSGPPSIHALRSPSASPAAASLTPASARRTPGTPGAGGAPGTECWVTVFGFAPALESLVQREYRRHGEIIRTIPGRGNWLHILYRTPLQASVALTRSWRLLPGTDTMIGTVPCTEPAVARETNDSIEKGVLLASPSAASPFGTPGVQTLRGGGLTPISSSRTPSSTLRTPASVIRRESTGGMQNIVRTPQRQTGILDYITGFYR